MNTSMSPEQIAAQASAGAAGGPADAPARRMTMLQVNARVVLRGLNKGAQYSGSGGVVRARRRTGGT